MAKMTTRRKLAIATWSAPREGNIYGKLTVDATRALEFIEYMREKTGFKVTITHFVGKAVAEALRREPTLNGRIVFGRYVQHDTVDVTYLVALDGGKNLAKAKIHNADQKSIEDIAQELRELATRLRKREDTDFEKSNNMLKLLPTWLIRPMINFMGFLTGALGIEMRALGLEAFPFGSCIITSVGMFGLDEGYAPPTPFARVPLYVLVGAIRKRPVYVGDEIVPQQQVTLTATIDHRFIDGFQGGVLAQAVRELFDNPWSLLGLEGPPEDFVPGAKAALPAPQDKPAEEAQDASEEATGEAS